MVKTNKKANTNYQQNLSGFSPRNLVESPALSSQKNLTGTARVIKDLSADVFNNIQRWNSEHINGAKVVKQIAVLKSYNCEEYTAELENHVINLYHIVQNLRKYKEMFTVFSTQMKAVSKLEKTPNYFFISMSIPCIERIFHEVSLAYAKEFEMKEYILENIAHSKNINEVMFLAASWTYQCNITNVVDLKVEALLTETGHRKIT